METVSSRLVSTIRSLRNFVLYYLFTFFSKFIDYFHYKLLSFYPYPIFTRNPLPGHIGNKCYGNLWAVKNALGRDFHSRCMIEHGLYFGEYVLSDECIDSTIDTIYTYSDYRKKAILKWFEGNIDKNIVTIGPYILYSKHFKSIKGLKKIKASLGKVLLVFPSHSFPGQLAQYDEEEFLNEIIKISKDYDTVLVSLYWLDIKRGFAKSYLDKGYKVVCSGVRSDRWFLARQKDLLWLSDMTMSNDIGTHIGYSIAMGVPHYLYRQKVEIEGDGVEYSNDIHNKIRNREYNELVDAFGEYSTSISANQISIVKKFWGKW